MYTGITYIFLFSAFLFVFKVAALSYYNRVKVDLKLLLILFEFVLFYEILENYLLITSKIVYWLPLMRTPDALHCLVGVLPYLYVKSYITDYGKFDKKDLIHFVWPVIFALLSLPVYLADPVLKLDLYYIGRVSVITRYLDAVQAALGLVYGYFTLKLIKDYDEKIECYISNIKSLKLTWMRTTVICINILFAIAVVVLLFGRPGLYPEDYSYYFSFLLLLLSIAIALNSIRQLPPLISLVKLKEIASTSVEKPEVSGDVNNAEEFEEYAVKITDYILKEKPHLDPNLKLSDLSKKVGIPQYIVSQVLNSVFNKNFNEFINDYRIEVFKEIVKSPKSKHLTILALAFDSGFNSKSSFNMQFKRREGLTPKAYIDSL